MCIVDKVNMYGRDILNHFQNDPIMQSILPDFENDPNATPVARMNNVLQRKEMKKTERFSNTLTHVMSIMLNKWIKQLGVQADPVKRLMCLFTDTEKFEPKSLNNLGDKYLNNEHIQVIAFMFAAYLDYHIKTLPNNNTKAAKIKLLETTLNKAKVFILDQTPNLHISSMAKEVYAILGDSDTDPYQVHEPIIRRIKTISQLIQHRIPNDYIHPPITPCIPHNFFNGCRSRDCTHPHICFSCHKRDHSVADPRCPSHHTLRKWTLDKIESVRQYYKRKGYEKRLRTSNYYKNGNNHNGRDRNDRYRHGYHDSDRYNRGNGNPQPDKRNNTDNRSNSGS